MLLSLRACVAWPAPRHSSIQEEPFLGPAVEQMHVSHSHLAMPAGTRGDFHYWRQIAGGALGLSQRAACRSASEMRCGRRPVRDKSADALAGHVNTGRENERKLTSRETKKKKKKAKCGAPSRPSDAAAFPCPRATAVAARSGRSLRIAVTLSPSSCPAVTVPIGDHCLSGRAPAPSGLPLLVHPCGQSGGSDLSLLPCGLLEASRMSSPPWCGTIVRCRTSSEPARSSQAPDHCRTVFFFSFSLSLSGMPVVWCKMRLCPSMLPCSSKPGLRCWFRFKTTHTARLLLHSALLLHPPGLQRPGRGN